MKTGLWVRLRSRIWDGFRSGEIGHVILVGMSNYGKMCGERRSPKWRVRTWLVHSHSFCLSVLGSGGARCGSPLS